MDIKDLDYALPEHAIAKTPQRTRGASRVLVLHKNSGRIEHRNYSDMSEYLNPGDLVILNNTRVIRARIFTKTAGGAEREILLLERHGSGSDPVHTSRAMRRGSLAVGQKLLVGNAEIVVKKLHADGTITIFCNDDLYELARKHGHVPLPPYINRAATENDQKRYQTLFAQIPGSVAAPTASLNFTGELHKKLANKGVVIEYITLHVGLGTFLPIREASVRKHVMHSEFFSIPKKTVQLLRDTREKKGRVLAMGTTVARTLEYAHDKIFDVTPAKTITGEANNFIYPGYHFKSIDMLLTNFHAPRTTVLLLAGAFAGKDNLLRAYKQALQQNYAFLSYGDSMFIL